MQLTMHTILQAVLGLLVALAWVQPGASKVFDVVWGVPENGLQLASVSTAKCGDVVRFNCLPGTTQGVYKLTSLNGTCPTSFSLPEAGVVLAPPTKNCDFSLILGDQPDFFVTSQAPRACQQNLKMYIHTVCTSNQATSASGVLGMTGDGGYGAAAVPGTRQQTALVPQMGATYASTTGAAGAVPANQAIPGLGTIGAQQQQLQQQQQAGARSAAAAQTARNNVQGRSWMPLSAVAGIYFMAAAAAAAAAAL